MTISEDFEKDGFAVARDIVPAELLATAQGYYFEIFFKTKTFQLYSDGATKPFDALLHPFYEGFLGKKLHKVCRVARIYKTGEGITEHKDRPACEYSVTLPIDSPSVSPIIMNGQPVLLEPGDVAFYKGCEVAHERPPVDYQYLIQLHLHYVDSDGPYADQKGDPMRIPTADGWRAFP